MGKRKEAERLRALKAGPRKRARLPALEWITDVGAARIILVSRNRALVENHRGILELKSDVIRLKTRSGNVSFLGSGLKVAELRREAALVTGSISSVELSGGGADG